MEIIFQLQTDNSWIEASIVHVRTMPPTETKYRQIDNEVLALTEVCEESWQCIVVKSIVLKTDHKPLVPHVSSNTLDQVLSWSQRFKMRLMRFNFKEINRIPGKKRCTKPMRSRDSKLEIKCSSRQAMIKK